MEKLDLLKKDRTYYKCPTTPELLNIGPARYISVCGKGDPSDLAFLENIQRLYPLAYHLKFKFKALGHDFVVPKLEALWWYDENQFGTPSIAESPTLIPRDAWEYRLLIRLPSYVQRKDVADAAQTLQQKHNKVSFGSVEFFEMHEGLCVQVLHRGPFNEEVNTLLTIEAFVKEQRLLKNGLHHEIYLSNVHKTAPGKLKTILREPVKPA